MGKGFGSMDASKKVATMYAKQNVNFANQKPYSQKKSVKRFFKKYRSNLPCYNYLYLLISCKNSCAGIKTQKMMNCTNICGELGEDFI